MKIEQPPEPEIMSIFVANIKRTSTLNDFRLVRRYGGFSFGTVAQVAGNYGITIKDENNGLLFTGPRTRLQMFAEKLHFSLVEYRQV